MIGGESRFFFSYLSNVAGLADWRWCRDAKILRGEEGEKLQRRVWAEIVGALEKDVPEVRELAGMV